MSSSLIIAAAGSGKTTHIVEKSSLEREKNIAVLTYTNENEAGIKRKYIEAMGYVPSNITVQSWFAFLMQHGARPYQGRIRKVKIKGLQLISGKSGLKFHNGRFPEYWPENDIEHHYFNSKNQIYSDKLSKFVAKCDIASSGLVVRRISKLFPIIYIDEIQDFAGYDFELIKLMIKNGIIIHCVGDPRQTTYRTHYDQKHKKYNGFNLQKFFASECRPFQVALDSSTLNISYRNVQPIINVSSALFPMLPIPISGNTISPVASGVYFIPESQSATYLETYRPMQLRLRKDTAGVSSDFPAINFGISKGREYDRVLIYPTKEMISWLQGKSANLKEKTRSQLYVALTRAKYSAAIVLSDDSFAKFTTIEMIGTVQISRISK